MRKLFSIAAAILVFTSTQARADKCGDITAYQEWVHGIPTHLLTAISHAESGQTAPGTGEIQAWPWTVTSSEGDIKHPTKWAAIQAVRDLQGRGIKNIDIGCMQINLKHHPRAFRNLNQAFNPAYNVAYAARFLKKLYRQTGDWRTAVAYYHSRNPEHYEPYQAKVEELWQQAREAAQFTSTYPGPTPTIEPTFTPSPAFASNNAWPRHRHWRSGRGWRRYSFTTHPIGGGTTEPVEPHGPWVPVTGGRFH
jgi:hypothetical protein